MRQLSKSALLLALLLVPSALFANHYSDFYVIPVASHVNGVNGTMWMSDLAIQNFSSNDLDVQVFVVESGIDTPDNVSPIEGDAGFIHIRAGGSALVKDILKNYKGRDMATGALLVGANAPFAVTSRSYSMAPSGDTVGQTVVPVGTFLDNTLGTTDNTKAVSYIPGVIRNSRFRTNLGFAAGTSSTSGLPMTVEFLLRGEVGQSLGSRSFTIPAGAFEQIQFPLDSLTTLTGDVNIGGVEVRITKGSGAVAPYASVIDNVTADAVYVSGVFPENAAPSAKLGPMMVSPFRELFDHLRR